MTKNSYSTDFEKNKNFYKVDQNNIFLWNANNFHENFLYFLENLEV